MIQLSPRVIELLQQPVIKPFYLVTIDNTRLTSHLAEIELSDGRVFSPGDLVALDPPRGTSAVDGDSYKITIADPHMEYGTMFEDGMVGTPVEVMVGFIDPVTDYPELDHNNTFILYRGSIDGVSYSIDLNEAGESLAVINCASPMSNLEMLKPFHTTKDFIRQIDPEDSCFDQIYEGAGNVQLKWGKS